MQAPIQMLHRDTSARFEKTGFWIFAQYRFVVGARRSQKGWSVAAANAMRARQQETPIALHEDASRRRVWWLFRDEIYWEDVGLSETEVKALALERLTKTDRRIKRAVAMMEQTSAFTAPSRETIPDDVKVFVWNRDGGRCVRCGSKERLEFDHVIPVALGGASTARNLQLLCETCNRSKGASIA
jgi:hypothetical protein